jgi:hypothetical protein
LINYGPIFEEGNEIKKYLPLFICSVTAARILGLQWPVFTALNIAMKSRYSFPSTSYGDIVSNWL